MSVLRIIETNPAGHSLCLFWSDWRKVCATSAAVGGGAPGLVPQERGTGRGRPARHREPLRRGGRASPKPSCARSDQTVRLGTQEQIQGMSFQPRQLLLVSLTARGLGYSLRLRSACCPCRAVVLRAEADGSPSCGYCQPLPYCLGTLIN